MFTFTINVDMRIAAIEIHDAGAARNKSAFDRMEACAAVYRDKYGDTGPGSVAGIDVARRLFRALGMDATKNRPSSEALLRRALKGQPLFHINTVVDAVNWSCLDFLLPICVYDAATIKGMITIRPGDGGETYIGHTGKEMNLEGKYVLVDDEGPFGNPISDAARTAVGPSTTHVLAIIFVPTDYDVDLLTTRAQTTAGRIIETSGGAIASITTHK